MAEVNNEFEPTEKKKERMIKKKDKNRKKANLEKHCQCFLYLTLEKVAYCHNSHYNFSGKTSIGKNFDDDDCSCCYKLPHIGNAIRNSGIDISYWDDCDFMDVIVELIVYKIKIGFDEDKYGNLYPKEIAHKHVKKIERAINRLLFEAYNSAHARIPRTEIDKDYTYVPLTKEEEEIRRKIKDDIDLSYNDD